MKRLLLLAALAVTVPAAPAAEGPPVPKGAGPAVGYGQVVVKDDKVVLALRQLDVIVTTEVRTVTEYQTVTRTTAQGDVTEKVPVTRSVAVTVQKPHAWRPVHLPLDTAGLTVTDAAGEALPALKLADKLAKETAVLIAVTDPPEAHYLQTVKPGTLIVVAPAALLGLGTAAESNPRPAPPGIRPLIRPIPRVIIQPPAPAPK